MALSLCFAPICSLKSSNRPGINNRLCTFLGFAGLCLCNSMRICINLNRDGTVTGNSVTRKAFGMKEACHNSKVRNFQSLEVKATEDNKQSTKSKSIVCSNCDVNGAILRTQCKGTGVNSVDHFNGQFKAGGLCWLCRGKKDILCGSCDGAGFLGGFMSTYGD